MKRILSIILFTIISYLGPNLVASNIRLDSILNALDKTVENREQFTKSKEHNIQELKKQLSQAAHNEQRYGLVGKLFELYSNYQIDSAYYYAQERINIAIKLNDKEDIANARMNLVQVLRTSGMYKEAFDELKGIEENKLQHYNIGYYYHLYHSLYILMRDYSISEQERIQYSSKLFSYKDSIIFITPQDDVNHYLVSSTKEIMLGNYDYALTLAENAYKTSREPALTNYNLSDVYRHRGDIEKQKYYLAESAIADLQAGIKEYISLRELATILYKEGDINRAYKYMKASMEDAIFCNARLRTLEASHMLPLINDTYDFKMKSEKNRLRTISIIAIILAVILLLTLIYLYLQVKSLSRIRAYQKKMNTELKGMNESLSKINSELRDSNLIKEEYISYVFNLCSSYIDKLESYRKNTNRKLKAGQIDDLLKITGSSSLVADELKEFYKNFDNIFLNMYPNFVDEFNNLLEDHEKIEPKEGDLLTPELRIFALVRLGINDSVKIAEFLHYSPQTIYNYRLKIRNKSKLEKSDFNEELIKIGLKIKE